MKAKSCAQSNLCTALFCFNPTKSVSGSFEELENLHEDDFDTEEEFLEERRMIQDEIMAEISYYLNSYLI